MDLFRKKNQGFLLRNDLNTVSGKVTYTIFILFGVSLIVVCFLPPIWLLLSSLKSVEELFRTPPTIIPEKLYPEKIPVVWNLLKFGKYYRNSFIMVIGSMASAVAFNGILAYTFSVLKPKGWKKVYNLVLWSLMIPGIISLAPLFINIVNLGLKNNFATLWLSFGANAFFVMLYKNFFDSIPKSFAESAMIDGASPLQIFIHLYFPLSMSINLVISIFAFNASWSDFLLPYLVLQDQKLHTVMIKLFTMNGVSGMSMDKRLIAIAFSIIPPTFIFIIFQKWINKGMSLSGGVKE